MSADKPPSSTPFKSLPFKGKLLYIRQVITVEPIVICYLLSSIICYPALSQLEYEKACRVNLNLTDTICDAIISGEDHNFTEENERVQTTITNMHSWQGPLQTFMPLVLILFIGSYSDRHSLRKPFFLLPLFGELFAVAGVILCVVFMREWPVEVQGVLQQVVPSFFGGQVMLIMAIFSYIADVSSLEMRIVRIGAVQISINCAVIIGQLMSGHFFVLLGYYSLLCIAGGLYTFAILYGLFGIKEERKKVEEKKSFFVDMFDPKHAIDTLNVVFKKRKGNNRVFIVIMFVLMAVYAIVSVGEAGVFFQYMLGYYHWTPVDYSYYATCNTVVHLVGTTIGVPLLSKVFKLNDFWILIISMGNFVFSNIIFGLASSTVNFYIASVCGIFTGIIVIGIRSLATKVVSPDDFGKAQSLFGIAEALGPLVGTPLYGSVIYNNSLNFYPGLYFFCGSIFYLCLVGIVVFMMLWDRKEKRRERMSAQGGEVNHGASFKMQETTHM